MEEKSLKKNSWGSSGLTFRDVQVTQAIAVFLKHSNIFIEFHPKKPECILLI